jgi:hypothetical protein
MLPFLPIMFALKTHLIRKAVIIYISAIYVITLQSCKTTVIEPEKSVPPGTGTQVLFPLDQAGSPGFSGELRLEKLSDGSAIGDLRVEGMSKGKRYFGKICRTNNSNPNLLIDFADLGEIGSEKPELRRHLEKDYSNQLVRFDSLLEMEGIVRILESDPAGGFLKEVLRGNFGSNLILSGEKNYSIGSAGGSNISGSLKFRQRKNGNLLLSGSISGMSDSDVLEINYFTGSSAGIFRNQGKLGQISADNAGGFEFNFSQVTGGLSVLDTLQGFIGFQIPGQNPDSVSLLAIANFGGNLSTGKQKAYFIYNPLDSSVIGKIEFEEFGAAGNPVRMRFSANQNLTVSNGYLSLHRGTSLDAADTIAAFRIPLTKTLEANNIPDGQGGLLRFNDLDNWNAHLRIAENDPLGESNLSGSADLGGNEVISGDTLLSYLNEMNPSFNLDGLMLFRKRRNGNVLSFFRLSSTQAGVENNLIVRAGPKPSAIYDTTAMLYNAGNFNGINPGLYKGLSKLRKTDGSMAKWADLMQAKQNEAYLEYSFFDSGDFQVICRGSL